MLLISHYSVCIIYDLSRAGRSTLSLITEHQPANYKLCLLSEGKLFSLIVDLNKTILAAFILRFVRHPDKNKIKRRANNVLFLGF